MNPSGNCLLLEGHENTVAECYTFTSLATLAAARAGQRETWRVFAEAQFCSTSEQSPPDAEPLPIQMFRTGHGVYVCMCVLNLSIPIVLFP